MEGPPQGDFVHDVRVAADIVRLISDHVSLKQAGRKLKGLCPFHNEKTPSFVVDPEKQLFFCFGCRVGGDAFKFLMQMEHLEFRDALTQLATRFGVPLPRRGRGERGGPPERLLEIHRAASVYYSSVLASDKGERARRYLRERGLGQETCKRLGIGFAAAGWENLRAHLRRQGYTDADLVKAGLVRSRGEGRGPYDWFRNRIVFPIERLGGGVIGFGGRLLDDGDPKYLNSPDTPLFNKGRHLYGLSWSRDGIREQGHAIIVEGYMDFASLWEAGVRNMVAVLGTGFTGEQARLLKRFTSGVVLNFDADRAGRQAADRAVEVLLERQFDIRVLELPEGQDPDDFVRLHGVRAYTEKVAGAPPFIEHLMNAAGEGKDLGRPEGKAGAVREVLPRLARIRSPVLRAAALGRLAERFHLPEEAVRDEFRRMQPARRGNLGSAARQQEAGGRRGTPAERRLLYLMLTDATVRGRLAEEAVDSDFSGLVSERLIAAVLGQHRAGLAVSVASLEQILAPEDRDVLMEIALDDFPGLHSGEVEACRKALEKERLERESRRLQQQLQEGREEAGDGARIDALLKKKLELRRRIDALS
ncbi:MAG: DNA primase [Acidobacteriota bacterium]